jgi:zinc transporter ZupT
VQRRAFHLIFFFFMSPILTSLLLGLTAAGANVFGGTIIVQKHWERSYLRYFVALGAGFMLATALVEMVPESIHLRGAYGGFLILAGYLLVHFFEHTVTPHFHFGEETHADQFVHSHKGYSVLIGLRLPRDSSFRKRSAGSSLWRFFCTRFRKDSLSHR